MSLNVYATQVHLFYKYTYLRTVFTMHVLLQIHQPECRVLGENKLRIKRYEQVRCRKKSQYQTKNV